VALFGRGPQADVLAALVDGARGGTGGAALVRGAPGIGKSALLASAEARASAAGFTVVRVLGEPAGRDAPYAGLQQFAHSLGVGHDALAGPQRSALAMALGAGEATVPDVFLVGLATLNLVVEAAARAPVLLVADDLQWIDDPTISILAFMGRRVRTEPVLLLGAARDGYQGRLAADELTTLTVPPLSDTDAGSLLDAIAPGLSPAARRRVLSDAAGNPLALTELSRVVTSGHSEALPLTERLERAFTDRLATLPGPTGTLLRMAAVNDSPALAEIIAAARAWTAATGEPEGLGPADLDPAVSAMLVDVVGTEVRFRHPLMRSAIHQSMTAAGRRAAHAALAEVLPAGQEDRRVRHEAAATALPDEAVAGRLAAVADRAARRGGVAAAVDALSRAAALSEDPRARTERLLRAADFAVELGQRDTVGRLLSEAADSGLSAQQQVKAAWLRGSFDEGLRQQVANATMLTALAQEVAAGGDVPLAVRILWSAAQLCFWSEPGPRVRQQVLEAAERLPLDELDPWLLAILAYVAPVERGAVVMDRARRVVPRAGDDGRAYRMLSTGALLCGAFDLSREFSAAAATALRAQGRLGLLARVVGAEAWSATVAGDLGAAIIACDESRRLARETSQQLMHALMSATAAKLAALRGEADTAVALAAEAEEVGLPAGARPVLATALMARGLAALGDGRFDEAYGHFRRLHDPADPAFQIALRLTTLGDLVDAATHSGRTEHVRPVVAELAEMAARTSAPVLHADLRLARALLAADDEAEALFEAALRADLGAWPLIRSRTQLAFGEWLRRHRRAIESRDHLRAARDMFDALGAIPWSERARRELRAAGEASARRGPDARDQLTPHELQIAQLAAEGLTNREIGQRLYLSHRTVSSHLHRIFPKLGVTSRSELRLMVGISS
jgi:DNA-binding CsgD family transcriptional regulator